MNVTRTEWVKMYYPDGPGGQTRGIVVGVIHPQPARGWVFDHRTDDSQQFGDAPMGMDVGTLAYLQTLQTPVSWVHFWPEGSAHMLQAPLVAFAARRAANEIQTVTTLKGQRRTRIFLPMAEWTVIPFYPETRPPFWAVTHLRVDGTVDARHVPH